MQRVRGWVDGRGHLLTRRIFCVTHLDLQISILFDHFSDAGRGVGLYWRYRWLMAAEFRAIGNWVQARATAVALFGVSLLAALVIVAVGWGATSHRTLGHRVVHGTSTGISCRSGRYALPRNASSPITSIPARPCSGVSPSIWTSSARRCSTSTCSTATCTTVQEAPGRTSRFLEYGLRAGALTTLVAVVRSWLGRRDGVRRVQLTIGGDTIELKGATPWAAAAVDRRVRAPTHPPVERH